MGSKVSLKPKRMKKAEFLRLCETIDRQYFLDYFLNNGNEAVCTHFNFGLNTMYRLVKNFEIKLTSEQLKYRNKIASEQRVRALHGVNNNFQRRDVQNKIKQNNLIKYGVENQFQRNEIQDKIKQTLLQKYGYEYIAQVRDVYKKSLTKYYFDGESFDSFPEVAVWIFAKDHNWDIEREPISFKYEYENKVHLYFPDFCINGQYVEIKGLQFFENKDPNKSMINPYNKSKNGIAEAKHQCAIQNNVAIWTNKDFSPYIKYVQDNYDINTLIQVTKSKEKYK